MIEQKIVLDEFANGALSERFNQSMQQVLENIADPNTKHQFKRKLNVTLTLTTNEDRELVSVDILTKSTLAPKSSVQTMMIVDKDLKGQVVGTEFGKQLKNQDVMVVDTETGELTTKSQYLENKEAEKTESLRIVK